VANTMDITIHWTFLPHNDPEASLAFYRDTLGFEVRNDVGQGKMRWITVGPPDQPGTSIVLNPPAADPGLTDDERRTIAEMMAKGVLVNRGIEVGNPEDLRIGVMTGDRGKEKRLVALGLRNYFALI
jgi:catechol 2,3-dioxygenase-like lactoylglutathione lyase family enzyme